MFSFDETCQDLDFLKKYMINTLYISEGDIELKISNENEDHVIALNKGKGLVFTSNTKITLIKNQAKIIIVSSLDNNNAIIEIEDNEGVRVEKELINYRIIENPKPNYSRNCECKYYFSKLRPPKLTWRYVLTLKNDSK